MFLNPRSHYPTPPLYSDPTTYPRQPPPASRNPGDRGPADHPPATSCTGAAPDPPRPANRPHPQLAHASPCLAQNAPPLPTGAGSVPRPGSRRRHRPSPHIAPPPPSIAPHRAPATGPQMGAWRSHHPTTGIASQELSHNGDRATATAIDPPPVVGILLRRDKPPGSSHRATFLHMPP